MYQIHKQGQNFQLLFDGTLHEQEIAQWVEQSNIALASTSGSFGMIVDMKNLTQPTAVVQDIITAGLKYYKSQGLGRSALIVDSISTKTQLKCIAQETGTYQWERYISADGCDNWQQLALEWINNGVDPDKNEYKKSA